MGAVPTTLTMEEFLALPDDPGRQELLHGRLIESPVQKIHHLTVRHDLLHLAEKRGEAYSLAGYQLGPDTMLQPDVSIPYPDQETTDYFQGSPQLVIEIASETSTPQELSAKLDAYLAHGAEEVWIVYLNSDEVRVYRAGTREPQSVQLSSLLGLQQ